jgi:hypothetical protein
MHKLTTALFAGLGCGLALSSAAVAQQSPPPGVLADEYAQSMQQNAKLLKQYSWTMRVVLTKDGEEQTPELYMMRHDVDGNLQKTPLTVQKKKSYRGLIGRMKKKDVDKAQKYLSSVAELVKQYATPSPGAMMDLFSRAPITPGQNGTVQISGSNFLNKGDSVVFVLDQATHQPKLYNFSTLLDKDEIEGTIKFGMVPNGPRYPSEINVMVPAKNLQAQVDTYNYVRQQQ